MTIAKHETIQEIHDILDSWNDTQANTILGKLSHSDLIELQKAIQLAIEDTETRSRESVLDGLYFDSSAP